MLPTRPADTRDVLSGRGRAFRVLSLLFLVVGLFGCDHATKIAAKASLEGSVAVPIAPSVLHGAVELRYVENPDIAFSLLRHLGVPRSPGLLIALSVFAIVGVVASVFVVRRRVAPVPDVGSSSFPSRLEARRDRVAQVGLALVVGGALGNLVDRIARGYVVDFIDVKGWPVFNVADVAVVAGMALIALRSWKARAPGSGSGPGSDVAASSRS